MKLSVRPASVLFTVWLVLARSSSNAFWGEPNPLQALKKCESKLIPGNKVGEVFDIHAKTFDDLGYNKARMNACGYSLGNTFSPNWMDWPMLYTGNPYVIQPGNVFFMHMILMDSDSNLAMNLGETYLVTESGNERLGKQKLDLVVL